VYTPQAIVNGRFATVGSNRKHIVKALSRPVNQSLDITFEAASQAGELTVLITGGIERRKALVGMGIGCCLPLTHVSNRETRYVHQVC